jgi:hypothetical protein
MRVFGENHALYAGEALAGTESALQII